MGTRSGNSFTPVKLVAGEDHREGCLAHAKLYVFADSYGIHYLMATLLTKLGSVLLSGCEGGMEQVVALFQYCFDVDEPRPERLRWYMMEYAVYGARLLWKSEGFRAFVASNREFEGEFKKVVRDLHGVRDLESLSMPVSHKKRRRLPYYAVDRKAYGP
jgi:hypothetical protein